jgi:four helix bundle protein
MSGAAGKPFDLEVRTFEFARQVRLFVKQLPRTISNIEDVKQLVRSSGSVGANYIEANESLGKKDLKLRLRIARKEAKETRYWLRLLDTGPESALEQERERLVRESSELLKILSAMLNSVDSGRQ